jgi:hypothetical protein
MIDTIRRYYNSLPVDQNITYISYTFLLNQVMEDLHLNIFDPVVI